MRVEKPGKGIAAQRFPGVGAGGQLNTAHATQLNGVPKDTQGTLDTGKPTVAGLNGGLILKIHRLRPRIADTFVELEFQGRHLFQAQSLEGHLGKERKTVANLPGHRGRRTALVASHCHLRPHSVPRPQPVIRYQISDGRWQMATDDAFGWLGGSGIWNLGSDIWVGGADY